jgi:hypothetical protein
MYQYTSSTFTLSVIVIHAVFITDDNTKHMQEIFNGLST